MPPSTSRRGAGAARDGTYTCVSPPERANVSPAIAASRKLSLTRYQITEGTVQKRLAAHSTTERVEMGVPGTRAV